MNIIVTGANGFIGRSLCRYFSERGYVIKAFVRYPEKNPELKQLAVGGVYKGDLETGYDERAIQTGDILIHCAYAQDLKYLQKAMTINIEGTKKLYNLAKQKGTQRFVFLSSFAALPEAESFYGQTKKEIELFLDPKNDLIIRPGLVIGRGGLFEKLQKSIRRCSIIPLFYGGHQIIQTILIDDLCSGIEKAFEKNITGIIHLAESKGQPIREFYQKISWSVGKTPHFIRLPGPLSLFILRSLESLHFPLPVSSENLLGLKQMRFIDSSADIKKLGITVSGEKNGSSL